MGIYKKENIKREAKGAKKLTWRRNERKTLGKKEMKRGKIMQIEENCEK